MEREFTPKSGTRSQLSRLLVIDDEPSVFDLVKGAVARHGIEVVTATTAAEGLEAVRSATPDAVLLDILLPDRLGLDLFRDIRQIDAQLPVIVITADANSSTAIEAMQLGALDYLAKPLKVTQVRDVVNRAFQIRRLVETIEITAKKPKSPSSSSAMIGQCAAMHSIYKAIGRVANQNVTVLIRGESGTGKELVARAIFQHSLRATAPFMAVNCAAIPESLLESELFGHEKGTFTGADRTRIGRFEQCNGGTLFLDEIGDMSPMLQSKLLRVLQDQQFERIGSNEPIRTDVRIIAATNRNVDRMVQEAEFRGDLFYRLNGYTINLPPLRDRGDDILLLIDHFLEIANRDLNRNVRGVAPDAMAALRHYSWPGNIRELHSVIRQSVLDTTGPVLFADALPSTVLNRSDGHGVPAASPYDAWNHYINERIQAGADNLYEDAISALERKLITSVLKSTHGNQVHASKILGVTRTTLRAKIKKHGIQIDRVIMFEASD